MRHRNIDNLFALFLIVCLGVFVADLATAQTQPEPITITLHTGTEADIPNFARAEYWELKTSGFLRDRNNEMEPLKTDLKIFTYALSDAYDTRLNEIISGTGSLGDLSVGSALASSLIKMRKNNQIWEIKRDMAEKYAQIAKQQLKINDYASDYDKVYAVFEAWWKYRRKSPSNTVPEQSPDPTSVTVPDPLSLECENECGVSWSASPSSVDALITKATTAHKKTCDEKPHKDYEYWACPDGNRSCDKSYEHYVVCNGKCGKEAPPTYEWMILLAHSPGKGEIVPPEIGEQTGGQVKVRTTIASHRRYCEDPTTRLTWNGKCNTWYYNCHVNYDSGMRTSCPMTGTHRTHDDGHWYDESSSISPSSGTSSAAAGSSYTVNLTTSTAFSSVYWYIKSSGTSGLGSSVGDGQRR